MIYPLRALARLLRGIKSEGPALTAEAITKPMLLAPHMDDDVLGCGGLLALRAQNKISEPRIVYLTDGSRGTVTLERDPELTAIRKKETHDALLSLGITSPDLVFLDRPDFSLAPDMATVAAIAAAIAEYRPSHILVNSPWDSHHDHKACCLALGKALGTRAVAALKPVIVLYEIYSPLVACDVIDITTVVDKKKKACLCHVSQQKLMPYGEYIAGLNLFRGLQLAPLGSGKLHYGEGYMSMSTRQYQRIISELLG